MKPDLVTDTSSYSAWKAETERLKVPGLLSHQSENLPQN